MQLGFKHIGLDDIDDLLPLRLFQREEGVPAGVPVPDEAPVEPRQEVEHVTNARNEVNERTQPNQYC